MNPKIKNALIISVATSITFAFVAFAVSMKRRKQSASELFTDIVDVVKNVVLSKSQESYIQNLHAKAQPIFRAFISDLEKSGWHVIITSGNRDSKKQAQLHKDNPANARAGYSMHEYGFSIDLNLDNGETYLNKSSSAEKWKASGVLDIAKKYNLFWGGNIAGYYDPIHFDMRNIYSIDYLRSKAIAQFGTAENIKGNQVNLG